MYYKKIVAILSFYMASTFGMEQGALQVVGLQQQSNTCFMNAALQCLFHTKDLTDFIINNPDLYPISSTGNSVGKEYYNFLQQYQEAQKNNNIVPTLNWCTRIWSLKDSNGKAIFGTGAQEDASEFLQKLLELLVEDINKPFKLQTLDFPLQQFPKTKISDSILTISKAYKENVLQNIRAEPMMLLQLQIEFDILKDLNKCLQNHFQRQYQTETIYNEKKIFKLPEYLIISLNRTGQNEFLELQKISKGVPFELHNLNLKPYLDKLAPEQGTTYDLYGIVLHSGGLGGGHYISYVNVNNEWYKCNDSTITKDDEITVEVVSIASDNSEMEFTPTILFYKKNQDIKLEYKVTMTTDDAKEKVEQIFKLLEIETNINNFKTKYLLLFDTTIEKIVDSFKKNLINEDYLRTNGESYRDKISKIKIPQTDELKNLNLILSSLASRHELLKK